MTKPMLLPVLFFLLLTPTVASAANGYGAAATCTVPTATTATCTFPAIPASRALLVKMLRWQCVCTTCTAGLGGATATVTFNPELGSSSMTVQGVGYPNLFGSAFQIISDFGEAEGVNVRAAASMRLTIAAFNTGTSNVTFSTCKASVTGTLTP